MRRNRTDEEGRRKEAVKDSYLEREKTIGSPRNERRK